MEPNFEKLISHLSQEDMDRLYFFLQDLEPDNVNAKEQIDLMLRYIEQYSIN